MDELDPVKCLGFNNIVVHCGVNDVRQPSVDTEEDVRDTYIKFKAKINQILHINKRAKVFVNLLLPTKLETCNREIKLFNNLLTDDLCKSYNRVKTIDCFKKFCDSNGFLSSTGKISLTTYI